VLNGMINNRLILQAADRDKISFTEAELKQQTDIVRASVGRPLSDEQFRRGVEVQYGSYSAFQTYLREYIIKQKYVQKYLMEVTEKAKIGDSITESEINNGVQSFRMQVAAQKYAQTGQSLSDEEFNEFMRQQGMDLNALREEARRQLMVQKYLISLAGGAPRGDQIEAYYNDHKAQYVRPVTISFDYIQIPFGSTAATKTSARTRADELVRKIGSKASAFNEECAILEASNTHNAGSVRYLQLSTEDPRIQQLLGQDFIDKATPLAEGAVSGVIEGRQHFFIIKVTSKFPKTDLGLDDTYHWGSAGTVRQGINDQLMAEALTGIEDVVINDIAEDLRKTATITIQDELLFW
ncbi:MAG: peptidyl-prolyl cis-trans isomerase, partial [Treponema sp.]|nr:peptidyl-prolyl cis-trans isomerase [Treponema sp.]